MKCVCISCFNSYDIRIRAVIEFLASRGNDVLYLTSDFNHYSKERFVLNELCAEQIHVLKYKHNISPSRIISHICFSDGVRKRLKKIKPDLIYCIFPPNSLVKEVNRYKKKNGSTTVVFDCFDFWPESLLGPNNPKSGMFPFSIWRNLREKHLCAADLIVSCTSQMKEYYQSKNYPVVLSWPSFSRIPVVVGKTDVSAQLSFCILGMINHIIDLDLVVGFLGRIAKSKRVVLHIIGKGDNLPVLERRLTEAGVEVVVHGVIFEFEKKKNIISQCNFGLSLPKTKINSGMALKLVEYLSFGLPVINSGLSDSHDLVEREKVGFNLSPKTLEDVVEQMVSLDEGYMQTIQNIVNCTYKKLFTNRALFDSLEGVIEGKN